MKTKRTKKRPSPRPHEPSFSERSRGSRVDGDVVTQGPIDHATYMLYIADGRGRVGRPPREDY